MKIIPETSQLQGHSLTWYALILWIEAGAKSLNQELHTPSSRCLQDIQVWVFWLHLRSTRTNLNSDLDSWGCPAKPTQTLDSLPLWCSMPGTRLQVSAASSWAGSLAIPKVAASSGLNPMLYSRSLLFIYFIYCCCCSVTKSCQTLWPHGLQHARLPCPSPTPGACSNSCPSIQWCHPAISSSVTPFSFCPQSFPASWSFLMSVLCIRWPKYWSFILELYILYIVMCNM